MSKLLGKIIAPKEALLGQSVLVEVLDPKGKRYRGRKDVQVLIGGIHGARQYLQFETEGSHVVRVVAIHKHDKKVFKETKQLRINVKAARPAKKQSAKKRSGASRSALQSPASAETMGALRLASAPNRPYLTRFSILDSQTNLLSPTNKSSSKRRSQPQTYTWTLGSGMTVKTDKPYLDYDFEMALDAKPDELFQNFHVEVKTKTGGKTQRTTRTLTVYNAYALCKRRGYLSPRVFNPRLAATRADGYEIILGIENIEPEPLRLNQQRIQPLGIRTSTITTELKTPLVIPAKTAMAISLLVSRDAVPKGSTGFALFLGGEATLNKQTLPVRIESYFDLPPRDVPTQQASAKRSREVLEITATTTVLGPAGSLLAETLPSAQLREQAKTLLGKKSKTGKTKKTSKAKSVTRRLPFLAEWRADVETLGKPSKRSATSRSAVQARVGDLCDPNSDGISGNLVCQLRIGERPFEIEVPAHYENASKGDVLLSLGGDGVIARLLRQVTPAQYYDHSGMITRDLSSNIVDNRPQYEAQQITHSTATTERLENFITLTPDLNVHIREDALKYMWPGVITQNIHESIVGEPVTDIDTGKTYTISSFSPTTRMFVDQGVWKIIPPLLVKPDPLTETPEIRRLLHEVADEARVQKSHYRLFCYTDATINTLAPASAGWAKDSFPSVCSSFIRTMLERKGIQLEGELEPGDLHLGAKKGKADGLYLYDNSERLTAAQDLHSYIMAQTRKFASGFISGLPRAVIDNVARQIANQIVNAFVSDDASAQSASSEAWKHPSTGDAVSPADILFWDSLPQGLYGYSTPARFRPTYIKVVSVHRWHTLQGTGSLSGTVTHRGNPVPGATVKLFKDKVAVTDAGGNFNLTGVPVGSYELEAFKENQAGVLTAAQLVHVITSETVTLELQSQGRSLGVQETASLRRGSSVPVKQNLDYDLMVSPLHPHNEFVAGVEWKEDGIKLEVEVKADWQSNLAIRLEIAYKVFLGSDENPGLTEKQITSVLPEQILPVTWQRKITTDLEVSAILIPKNSQVS